MGLKTVGLISGGKDSCYNLVECVKNGHELVALAHLHPPANVHELDSFMYQTVGSEVVKAIADCMDLPLFLREITGAAVHQKLSYSQTQGDEVEDLYQIIKDVQHRFPQIQAVAAGAVLSTYQRNRVENVCQRLGLTSLAYLWQRPQADLLNDMIAAGMECIIVKIASIGLNPEMLGKSIKQLREKFLVLEEKYGFHVCGEGGEYETITLDCPLFKKKKIMLDRTEVVLTDDVPFAPVAHLVVKDLHFQEKKAPALDAVGEGCNEGIDRAGSNMVSPAGSAGFEGDSKRQMGSANSTSGGVISEERRRNGLVEELSLQQTVTSSTCYLSHMKVEDTTTTLEERTRSCFQELFAELSSAGWNVEDICFVTLYLGDMAQFQRMNGIYCQLFPQQDPPSRACIELPLSAPGDIAVELVAVKSARTVLHVRSLSYWAPVCIGPYSQANVVDPGVVWVAGQIALDPASMKLDSSVGKGEKEVALVLRHIRRILECLSSSLDEEHVLTLQIFYAQTVYDPILQAELTKSVCKVVGDVPMIATAVPRLPRDAGVEIQCVACQSKLEKMKQLKTDEEAWTLEGADFSEGVQAFAMHVSKDNANQDTTVQEMAGKIKEKCQFAVNSKPVHVRAFYDVHEPKSLKVVQHLREIWKDASVVSIPVAGLLLNRIISVSVCTI